MTYIKTQGKIVMDLKEVREELQKTFSGTEEGVIRVEKEDIEKIFEDCESGSLETYSAEDILLSRYSEVNLEISNALIVVNGSERLTLTEVYKVATLVSDHYKIRPEDLMFCSNKTETKDMSLKEIIVVLTGKSKPKLLETPCKKREFYEPPLLENGEIDVRRMFLEVFDSVGEMV